MLPQAGTPLDPAYRSEDVELVTKGCCNLARHVKNALAFGVPPIVAINRFATDTEAELEAVRAAAMAAGAAAAVICEHHATGGAGARALAQAVVDVCARQAKPDFQFTYPDSAPLVEKIEAVAKKIYGAASVDLSPDAAAALARFTAQGFGHLPICIAKTQYSFSSDAAAKGAPSGFVLPIRAASLSVGAGFVVVYVGTISTMPGLPTRPAYYEIDIDPTTEKIVGLS